MARLVDLPGYRRFWVASAVSIVGSYLTGLALQVLAVRTLHASATQLGVLNAARYLPYLLLGLFAGVIVDRYRRKPLLVGADLGRAVLLATIPLLAVSGLADATSYRTALWAGIGGLVISAAVLGLSPFRQARLSLPAA
jgi:MFS family permease